MKNEIVFLILVILLVLGLLGILYIFISKSGGGKSNSVLRNQRNGKNNQENGESCYKRGEGYEQEGRFAKGRGWVDAEERTENGEFPGMGDIRRDGFAFRRFNSEFRERDGSLPKEDLHFNKRNGDGHLPPKSELKGHNFRRDKNSSSRDIPLNMFDEYMRLITDPLFRNPDSQRYYERSGLYKEREATIPETDGVGYVGPTFSFHIIKNFRDSHSGIYSELDKIGRNDLLSKNIDSFSLEDKKVILNIYDKLRESNKLDSLEYELLKDDLKLINRNI